MAVGTCIHTIPYFPPGVNTEHPFASDLAPSDPSSGDVVRVWYQRLCTLNGLGGASATTIPGDIVGAALVGRVVRPSTGQIRPVFSFPGRGLHLSRLGERPEAAERTQTCQITCEAPPVADRRRADSGEGTLEA